MERSWSRTNWDDAEFERQYRTAVEEGHRTRETEPRAVAASYDGDARRVVVELRNGLAFAFPAARFPSLASLSPGAIDSVQVTASGHALHWEEADLHLPVAYLIAEVFGTFTAAETGRVGGSIRSAAKAEAARKNARQGGRPPTRARYESGSGELRVDVRAGQRQRRLVVRVGGDYVVDPLNPAARRFRGRSGSVEAIRDDGDGRVEIRFHDTGRVGVVDARDLRPMDGETPAAAA